MDRGVRDNRGDRYAGRANTQGGQAVIGRGVRNREVSPEASADGFTASRKTNAIHTQRQEDQELVEDRSSLSA